MNKNQSDEFKKLYDSGKLFDDISKFNIFKGNESYIASLSKNDCTLFLIKESDCYEMYFRYKQKLFLKKLSEGSIRVDNKIFSDTNWKEFVILSPPSAVYKSTSLYIEYLEKETYLCVIDDTSPLEVGTNCNPRERIQILKKFKELYDKS